MVVNGWRLKYLKARKRRPAKPKMECYQDRNGRISELGYRSYREYLASPDWRAIRDSRLRDFPRCLLCEKPACQVHHMDYGYPTLLGLIPALLVSLCDSCHECIEFADGHKRDLAAANSELRRRAHDSGLHRWLVSAKSAMRLSVEMMRRPLAKWREAAEAADRHQRAKAARKAAKAKARADKAAVQALAAKEKP